MAFTCTTASCHSQPCFHHCRYGIVRSACKYAGRGRDLERDGTEFLPEGRGLIRHHKQQHYLAAQACLYYPVYPCFSLRAA
ncbi:TPA: hypothetical protein MIW75_18395 [Klebsiella pneumoniae]|nr:hypothetical protein [Klebsiella pneumoniae]